MQIEVIVQLADGARDAQIFGLLDRHKSPVQVFAERPFEECRRSRRLDRGAPVHRHGRARNRRFIAIAGGFRPGVETFVETFDDAGKNVFAEAAGESWSLPLLRGLGGLIQTMAESMLVFAPHANSWRRFVSQSYAPVAPTWGVNNRSVALRVPAGDAKNRRIEHRPSGVDANPYLVATTVLAGIAKGLDEGLDPGPETTGNGYEAAVTRTTMPVDWRAAIEAARASDFLKEALGEDLHRTFVAIKQSEYLRVARTVSELDYHLYLHEV